MSLPFSGERCISQAIYEWQWEWVSGEGHCDTGCCLPHSSSSRCEQPFVLLGTLRLGVRSRIFFRCVILPRQFNLRAMFSRSFGVIIVETLCAVPKSPRSVGDAEQGADAFRGRGLKLHS